MGGIEGGTEFSIGGTVKSEVGGGETRCLGLLSGGGGV